MNLDQALEVARAPEKYSEQDQHLALRKLAHIVEYVQRVVKDTPNHDHKS